MAPSHYAVVLFPGFQTLDVFGPVDILNILSRRFPLKVSLLAATLDPVSTNVGEDSNTTTQAGGWGAQTTEQRLVPTHTFENAPQDIDVLLVPGGPGTRHALYTKPVVEYLKTAVPKVEYLLTVCTGSAIAAQAGLLDGKRATSNKTSLEWVKAQGPNVNWVDKARWVQDGNIWTSSGISAGIDMTYAFVGAVYGEDTAETIAYRAEYIRVKDPNNDPFTRA